MAITSKIRMGKTIGYIAVMVFCAVATLSQSIADETISVNTQFSADMTVNGTLYLANGVTLDLNGHNLTVSNIVIPDYEDVPGYKFVDFLQTTSSGKQWINTEYTPACSDRVETKIRYMPIGDSFQSLFCTRGPSHAGTFTAFVKTPASALTMRTAREVRRRVFPSPQPSHTKSWSMAIQAKRT